MIEFFFLIEIPGGAGVKNPPAKAGDIEPSIQPLDWDDPLEEDMATSEFLPGESHGQRSLEGYSA